jgi:ribosomal protein S18 acetylase RimI-like enzyme
VKPALEDVLALDVLCLRDAEGGSLDAARHRELLAQSLPRSEWAVVYRDGILVAYGYLWPKQDGVWFVGGLAIHPDYRGAATVRALADAMRALISRTGALRLESHVRRDNRESQRLHRRLGFVVVQESDRATAFTADCTELLSRLPG